MTPTIFLRSPGRKRKPEADFQRAIVQYLKARFGPKVWILNHRGGIGQRAGVPDLLCCIDGRFLALEVKSPLGTGRLGPRQREELEAIRQAGGVVAVVSNWEELEEVLKELRTDATCAALREAKERDEIPGGLRRGLD